MTKTVELRYNEDEVPAACAFFVDGTPAKVSEFVFGQFSNDKPGKEHQRILASEHGNMAYVGSNFAAEGSGGGDCAGKFGPPADQTCEYMLAVVDRKRKRASLHPVACYGMAQRVKNPRVVEPASAAGEEEEEDEAAADEDSYARYRETKEALVEAFGGKLKRKIQREKAGNTISLDAVHADLKGSLKLMLTNQAAQSAVMPDSPENGGGAPSVAALPPFDQEATTPGEAFPLSGLVGDAELVALEEPAEALLGADDETVEEWRRAGRFGRSRFVHNAVSELSAVRGAAASIQARLVLYLAYLVRFRALGAGGLNNEEKFAERMGDVPEQVRLHLLSTFAERDTRRQQRDGSVKEAFTQSKLLKDKLLSFVFVLTAHIYEFNFNVTQLILDLALSKPKAVMHLRSLGFTVKTITGAKIAGEPSRMVSLSLPLTFPKPRIGRQS